MNIKNPKTLPQILNMNFGFMGIQFGWGLQMANMSAIYEYLGAQPDEIPFLWLAAPLTGLIVQPIIGQLSDRTWTKLGRRRPYFLLGALLSSLALIMMPHSSSLWMAAGLLWILDASINISMEPFRAFVADQLPQEQTTLGFSTQSMWIGIGAVLASCLPWLLSSTSKSTEAIPQNIRYSFYIGAFFFLMAILWTVFTTPEAPPKNMDGFLKQKKNLSPLKELKNSFQNIPPMMWKLMGVQFFTWLGLFCMWLFFPVAVARNIFQAQNEQSSLYHQGIEWAGVCFGVYSFICFLFSFFMPKLSQSLGESKTHSICLAIGALGLFSVNWIQNPNLLLISMVGVGIAWASILAMPYALLSKHIPAEKTGTYMGIFNFSIVIPEVLSALTLGWMMKNLLNNNRMSAVVLGGVFLFIAATLNWTIQPNRPKTSASKY